MSASDDARDLAETLVSLDTEIREQARWTSKVHRSCVGSAYSSDGKFLGRLMLHEGEDISLSGLDMGLDGRLFVVFSVDDPDEGAPVKWQLRGDQVEDSLPDVYNRLNTLADSNTDYPDWASYEDRLNTVYADKTALVEIGRSYLKEGRRAFLERAAENDELAAQDFYEAKDDFGLF